MEAPRDVMNSTLGNELEQLRGVAEQEKRKGTKKKINVAPCKAYISKEEEKDREKNRRTGTRMRMRKKTGKASPVGE